MTDLDGDPYLKNLSAVLFQPTAPAATLLAEAVREKHPGAAVLLYGSGNSVSKDDNPEEILFDFYVITPTYRDAYNGKMLPFLNWLIPPNVFYIENDTPLGKLRAKYAVLSIDHFEKLVSKKTFHSYFWARFAQPARIVCAPNDMRTRLVEIAATAVETFLARAVPLAASDASPREVYAAGLNKSYKAELRAEPPGRVEKLLDSYGDWPDRVFKKPDDVAGKSGAEFGWFLRSVQGGYLSIIRLLKGTMTFEGGVDYIAWKISRHSGVKVPIKEWERRHPFFGAPVVALRYYRMRAGK